MSTRENHSDLHEMIPNHCRRGRFITVEGIEGAGKSTALAFIQSQLEQTGCRTLLSREPGGTPVGEEIRSLLLTPRERNMSVNTELLLLFASRAEHLTQKILPALDQGIWVVCDRFADATYAYQGSGRGISWERIRDLEGWFQEMLYPDLTLLLDLPVSLGLERARGRSPLDRFEIEHETFFQRVRTGYQEIAAREPERVKLVDASVSLPHVHRQLASIINYFLETVDHKY